MRGPGTAGGPEDKGIVTKEGKMDVKIYISPT